MLLKSSREILYNRLNTYLNENDILYNEKFTFQKGYSSNHAIVNLSDQISQASRIFIVLKKEFDAAGHKILKRNLSIYGA